MLKSFVISDICQRSYPPICKTTLTYETNVTNVTTTETKSLRGQEIRDLYKKTGTKLC